MRRRNFLALIAATVAPVSGRAQAGLPTVGYLGARPLAGNDLVAAFQRGLGETGYVENRTVKIEYRSSEGRPDRLPQLAAELIALNPGVLFAATSESAVAAKAVTTTIPIVFAGASDPVRLGLVASLNRPGGNLTGVTRYAHALGPKRLQLLLELAPATKVVAVLVNPSNPNVAGELQELAATAAFLGVTTMVHEARTDAEIERGFAAVAEQQVRALYIFDDPVFTGRLASLVATLALRHGIATLSSSPAFSRAGALASYGADFADVHRQCGVYVGRILKGAKPADLPVMLPTKFELAINLKTARALGIVISPTLLANADEVIE